jgi:hypothetical protein
VSTPSYNQRKLLKFSLIIKDGRLQTRSNDLLVIVIMFIVFVTILNLIIAMYQYNLSVCKICMLLGITVLGSTAILICYRLCEWCDEKCRRKKSSACAPVAKISGSALRNVDNDVIRIQEQDSHIELERSYPTDSGDTSPLNQPSCYSSLLQHNDIEDQRNPADM